MKNFESIDKVFSSGSVDAIIQFIKNADNVTHIQQIFCSALRETFFKNIFNNPHLNDSGTEKVFDAVAEVVGRSAIIQGLDVYCSGKYYAKMVYDIFLFPQRARSRAKYSSTARFEDFANDLLATPETLQESEKISPIILKKSMICLMAELHDAATYKVFIEGLLGSKDASKKLFNALVKSADIAELNEAKSTDQAVTSDGIKALLEFQDKENISRVFKFLCVRAAELNIIFYKKFIQYMLESATSKKALFEAFLNTDAFILALQHQNEENILLVINFLCAEMANQTKSEEEKKEEHVLVKLIAKPSSLLGFLRFLLRQNLDRSEILTIFSSIEFSEEIAGQLQSSLIKFFVDNTKEYLIEHQINSRAPFENLAIIDPLLPLYVQLKFSSINNKSVWIKILREQLPQIRNKKVESKEIPSSSLLEMITSQCKEFILSSTAEVRSMDTDEILEFIAVLGKDFPVSTPTPLIHWILNGKVDQAKILTAMQQQLEKTTYDALLNQVILYFIKIPKQQLTKELYQDNFACLEIIESLKKIDPLLSYYVWFKTGGFELLPQEYLQMLNAQMFEIKSRNMKAGDPQMQMIQGLLELMPPEIGLPLKVAMDHYQNPKCPEIKSSNTDPHVDFALGQAYRYLHYDSSIHSKANDHYRNAFNNNHVLSGIFLAQAYIYDGKFGQAQQFDSAAEILFDTYKLADAKLQAAHKRETAADLVGEDFSLYVPGFLLQRKEEMDAKLAQLQQSLTQLQASNKPAEIVTTVKKSVSTASTKRIADANHRAINWLQNEMAAIRQSQDYVIASAFEDKQRAAVDKIQYQLLRGVCREQLCQISTDGLKTEKAQSNAKKPEIKRGELNTPAEVEANHQTQDPAQQNRTEVVEEKTALMQVLDFYYLQCLQYECITPRGTINWGLFQTTVRTLQQRIAFDTLDQRKQEQQKVNFSKLGHALLQTLKSERVASQDYIDAAVEQFLLGDPFDSLLVIQGECIGKGGTINFEWYKIAKKLQEKMGFKDFDLARSQTEEKESRAKYSALTANTDSQITKDVKEAALREWQAVGNKNMQYPQLLRCCTSLAIALIEKMKTEDNADQIVLYVNEAVEQIKRSQSIDALEALQKYLINPDKTINLDFYKKTKPILDLLTTDQIKFNAAEQPRFKKMLNELGVAFIHTSNSVSENAVSYCGQAQQFLERAPTFESLMFVQEQCVRDMSSMRLFDFAQYRVVKALQKKMISVDLTVTQQQQQQAAHLRLGKALVAVFLDNPMGKSECREEAIVQLELSNSFEALTFIHRQCLINNHLSIEPCLPIAAALQEQYEAAAENNSEQKSDHNIKEELQRMHYEIGTAYYPKRKTYLGYARCEAVEFPDAENGNEQIANRILEQVKHQLERAEIRKVLEYVQNNCILEDGTVDVELYKFSQELIRKYSTKPLFKAVLKRMSTSPRLGNALEAVFAQTVVDQITPKTSSQALRAALMKTVQNCSDLSDKLFCVDVAVAQFKLAGLNPQQLGDSLTELGLALAKSVKARQLPLLDAKKYFAVAANLIHGGKKHNESQQGLVTLQEIIAINHDETVTLDSIEITQQLVQNKMALEPEDVKLQRSCFHNLGMKLLSTLLLQAENADKEKYFLAAREQFIRGQSFSGYIELQRACLAMGGAIGDKLFESVIDLQQVVLRDNDQALVQQQYEIMGRALLRTAKKEMSRIENKDTNDDQKDTENNSRLKGYVEQAYQNFIKANSTQGLVEILDLCIADRESVNPFVDYTWYKLIKDIVINISDRSDSLVENAKLLMGIALVNTAKQNHECAQCCIEEAYQLFEKEKLIEGMLLLEKLRTDEVHKFRKDLFAKIKPTLEKAQQYVTKYVQDYKNSVLERCRKISDPKQADFSLLQEITQNQKLVVARIGEISFAGTELAELRALSEKVSSRKLPETQPLSSVIASPTVSSSSATTTSSASSSAAQGTIASDSSSSSSSAFFTPIKTVATNTEKKKEDPKDLSQTAADNRTPSTSTGRFDFSGLFKNKNADGDSSNSTSSSKNGSSTRPPNRAAQTLEEHELTSLSFRDVRITSSSGSGSSASTSSLSSIHTLNGPGSSSGQ